MKGEKMKNFMLSLVVVSLVAFMVTTGESAKYESLGLYLDFDQVVGDKISDLSGKGNDGTIEGNPKLEDGKFGQALQFDGKLANKVIVEHDQSLNPVNGEITVMAWVCATPAADWDLAILKWQDENPPAFSYHFSLHTKKFSLYFAQENGDWGEAIGDTVLSAEQWYHIAAVADGAKTVKVYLDGEEDGSVKYDGTMADTDVDVCIGGKIAGALFPFHGKIDELAIFSRALEQAEIKKAMEGISSLLAVEPQGKLAVRWAAIKKGDATD